jgi:hypothetical protein
MSLGIVFTIILVVLLIFMELPITHIGGKTLVVGRMKARFATLAWLLFIIFGGMLYTKVLMVLAT